MAHTPGPWTWDVTPGGDVRLVTPDRGKLYVMGFVRKGMRGAQPTLSLWGDGERGRRGGIMHDFLEAGGADHPDARLIAAAPALLEAIRRVEKDWVHFDGETFEDGEMVAMDMVRKAIELATGVRS